ncbi:HAD-IC family P-type ATPase [Dactylosporangium sp. NPDC005572]|uniref:HAD-IC family P-type ATPase n=1 Tax=Dactylosporangium sp. NPDC005572 TaxID=3156889 RepID=UPI0033B87A33
MAHIEIRGARRGLVTAEHGRLVEETVAALRGVDWAAWNAALGRVIVSYDEGVDVGDLLEAVTEAESRFLDDGGSSLDAESRQRVTLAADLLGAAGSFVARRLRLPPAARELAAVVALVDHLPGVRSRLRRVLGHHEADLVVSAVGATINAAGQAEFSLLADAALRGILLREMTAQRDTWQRRAVEVNRTPTASRVASVDGERPTELPDGPLERYSRRVSMVTLLAAAAATQLPSGLRRAARVLMAGSPVPASTGREAFAGSLGRVLARRDVLVRDRTALRRLDRVDTVVVDAGVLTGGQRVITHVAPVEGSVEAAWEAAARLVGEPPGRPNGGPNNGSNGGPDDDWALTELRHVEHAVPDAVLQDARSHDGSRGTLQALTRGGAVVAVVLVEQALDPLTAAVIAAGRRVGKVLLAGAPADVRRRVPADGTVPGGSRLAGSIRALQADGRVVVLIGGRNDTALAAADCGFGVLHEDRRPPWGAHLMGGPGLETAWLLLEAAAVARTVSRRSTHVALQGSVAGAVLGLAEAAEVGARRTSLATAMAQGANIVGAMWAVRGLSRRTPPAPAVDVAWHALPVAEVMRALGTTRHGLDEDDAERRRRDRAPTDAPTGRGVLGTIVGELDTPLTLPLAAGAGVSAATGATSDAALVLAVILANAVLSGIQDVAARRALQGLVNEATPPVRLRRAGVERIGHLDELVPGDVVLLEPGDAVPADGRLLDAAGLEMDESPLTGESVPVAKDTAAARAEAIAERTSMVYAGTTVAAGSAVCVVVATGAQTEAGRNALIALREPPRSGVQQRLRELTKASLPAAGASAAALLGAGLLRGRLAESVNNAVALAVAAIPEGLPFIATAAELSASRRLSRRNILVRDPRSMEALGRADVICFDKTGTLTEGRIALRSVSDGRSRLPLDRLTPRHREILAAALRASPAPNGGGALPHPTDQAVVTGAATAGVGTDEAADGWRSVRELPFEPVRGFHAVLGAADAGQVISVKGAPEITLPRCVSWRSDGVVRPLTPAHRQEIEAEVDRMARQGLRVLAIAERAASSRGRLDDERVDGMEFLGLLGLADPSRPSAAEAVELLRRAGIRVLMLTGDHPSTAAAVAAELGLLDGGTVVTGPELDGAAGDEAIVDALVSKASVFARVSPAHKVAVVEALHRAGHSVAVTGDGANDAPAIRLADVGIALGEQATAAARQAADLIVLDGRIETIVDGVVEGRAMWASVRESLALLLGGNLGEILFTVGGSLASATPPLNTRQILFVNLMTDLLPAITVAARPPKHVSPDQLVREGPEASLGRLLAGNVVRRAVATSAATAGAWLAAKATGTNARASTVALASLVGAQLGQTALLSGGDPIVLGAAGVSTAALVGVVQTPGLSQFFGCRPLGPFAWSIVLTATAAGTALGALRLPLPLPKAATPDEPEPPSS